MTSSYTAILPGARARNEDGFIGTVEGLQHAGKDSDLQPDSMVVRSEDGRWRYLLPLFLVSEVRQEPLHPLIYVSIHAGDLPHYISERLQEQAVEHEPVAAIEGDEHALRVPVLEEEIVTRKVPTLLGTAHIHTGTQTEQREVTVPLHREKLVVEHIAPEQFDASAPTRPNEVVIPVVEEELVVTKRPFVKEYLRVRKEIMTEDQTVRQQVRREVVEVSEPAQAHEEDAKNLSGKSRPRRRPNHRQPDQPEAISSKA